MWSPTTRPARSARSTTIKPGNEFVDGIEAAARGVRRCRRRRDRCLADRDHRRILLHPPPYPARLRDRPRGVGSSSPRSSTSSASGIEDGLFPARPSPPAFRLWVDCAFCDPDGSGHRRGPPALACQTGRSAPGAPTVRSSGSSTTTETMLTTRPEQLSLLDAREPQLADDPARAPHPRRPRHHAVRRGRRRRRQDHRVVGSSGELGHQRYPDDRHRRHHLHREGGRRAPSPHQGRPRRGPAPTRTAGGSPDGGGNPTVRSALDTLDHAAIGTLHAFAARVLREFPIEAEVPPAFAVLDEVGLRPRVRTTRGRCSSTNYSPMSTTCASSTSSRPTGMGIARTAAHRPRLRRQLGPRSRPGRPRRRATPAARHQRTHARSAAVRRPRPTCPRATRRARPASKVARLAERSRVGVRRVPGVPAALQAAGRREHGPDRQQSRLEEVARRPGRAGSVPRRPG